MKMEITIPQWYRPYVDMLIEAGLCSNEQTAFARVFEDGLREAESDADLSGEPDVIDLDAVLSGEPIIVNVTVTVEQFEHLEQVSKGYDMPIGRAAAVVIAQGLFEQCLDLKQTQFYKDDSHFRIKVDNMPHDPCYDEPE